MKSICFIKLHSLSMEKKKFLSAYCRIIVIYIQFIIAKFTNKIIGAYHLISTLYILTIWTHSYKSINMFLYSCTKLHLMIQLLRRWFYTVVIYDEGEVWEFLNYNLPRVRLHKTSIILVCLSCDLGGLNRLNCVIYLFSPLPPPKKSR